MNRATRPVAISLQKAQPMLDKPLTVVVRPSTEQDVPFMVDIYAYHVQNGLGDFQPEPLHPEDIKRRRKAMLKRRLPHIVAELNGAIVGYAYAVPFLKRPAYRYAVKHSDLCAQGPSPGRSRPQAAAGADRGLRGRRLPPDGLLYRRQQRPFP